jgi:hypothetical protein
MFTEHQKIAKSLSELGYTSGWVLTGTEITWIDEPEIKPTQKQIADKVLEIESILEERVQAEKALKVSAYTKLGLTEEEINAIL